MSRRCSATVLENFFEPCLLYLLLRKPDYGYSLMKNLAKHCSCPVNVGNLYRGLSRLSRRGKIRKTKRTGDIGPDKIVYSITPAGEKYLREWIGKLEQQKTIISKLVTNYNRFIES